jgi:hypothetical protein
LNDGVLVATNADCDRGVLYATASGRQAYQPKANGISLFGQALPEQFYRESERALADKVDSPLGAAVAALVLLKANHFELMHDWARNVENWFPWIPDSVIVWTEQCAA